MDDLRLWSGVTEALKRKDQNAATDEKCAIEETQREERTNRGGDEDWQPRFFQLRGEDWHPKFSFVIGHPTDASCFFDLYRTGYLRE